jgi:tRNA1(Val) A37 N6-methylase TrmN6
VKNNFYQYKKGSYRYNSDSLFITDFASSFEPKGDVLDVGCGCGIIGILLSKFHTINLHQIEIQKNMQYLTKQNNRLNNITSNLFCVDYTEFMTDKKFDLIVSNPPFFGDGAKETQDDSVNICKFNRYMPLEKFILKTKSLLRLKASFIFCYDAKQFQNICTIMHKQNFNIEAIRFVFPDKNKKAKLVMIKAKVDSKSAMQVLPPLFIFKKGEFTKEAKDIQQRLNTFTLPIEPNNS